MHKRPRFYTALSGPNDDAFQKVIQVSINLSKELKDISRIVFVAATLSNDGWLERQYGIAGVKKLRIGTKLENCEVIAKFESLKKYRPIKNEILITLGLDSEEILFLDDNINISALISVPWQEDDVEKWAKITGAIELSSNEVAKAYNNIPCIVQKALIQLTNGINKSTGLSHEADREAAEMILNILHEKKIKLNEIETESFLIRLGWKKKNANSLILLVKKFNRKTFKGSMSSQSVNHLDRWERECQEIE